MTAETTKRRKYTEDFKRVDGHSFAFAGIWTNRKVDDEWVSSYAIVTTDADELSAPIHDRMPLIVHPRRYDAWLSRDAEPQDYRSVIENPGDNAEYEVSPVSKSVNSPKNDSPELASRVSL
jgi:putative SOS response-associated peptidase YedK